ncbi:hypothetical protein LAZ67_13001961 [Cordylochernes scorpioides]|uniref:RNase H type-1 domain-containing protein n=1 Tax=Cordylochernes scorpioides TaxID=51811 RepID=A0ABY6L524_9ARAC|nr:hypothetical protein LAZ67_13001961 [Cordylochernes scorpioides]
MKVELRMKYLQEENQPRGKFAPRSEEYRLVGYSPESKAYRLWKPGTGMMIKSRDVRFLESENSTSRNDVVQIEAIPQKKEDKSLEEENCTAFQAELSAILWAAQIAETSLTKTAVILVSDCRSALSAICSSGPTHTSLVANIIKFLNRAPYIRLCWVPRHTGINGNELADSAAKIAATSVLPHSNSILPRTHARNLTHPSGELLPLQAISSNFYQISAMERPPPPSSRAMAMYWQTIHVCIPKQTLPAFTVQKSLRQLGHYVAETTRNVISAWDKDTNSERTPRRWFENFLNGDTSLGDEESRGRPSVMIIMIPQNPSHPVSSDD